MEITTQLTPKIRHFSVYPQEASRKTIIYVEQDLRIREKEKSNIILKLYLLSSYENLPTLLIEFA